MAERRYNDKEIAAIFRTATETPQQPAVEHGVPADEGLTLSDLQAIGREVGIPAEAVGAAFIASGALRLPRWARIRQKQMEALAAQVGSGSRPEALPPKS